MTAAAAERVTEHRYWPGGVRQVADGQEWAHKAGRRTSPS